MRYQAINSRDSQGAPRSAQDDPIECDRIDVLQTALSIKPSLYEFAVTAYYSEERPLAKLAIESLSAHTCDCT